MIFLELVGTWLIWFADGERLSHGVRLRSSVSLEQAVGLSMRLAASQAAPHPAEVSQDGVSNFLSSS